MSKERVSRKLKKGAKKNLKVLFTLLEENEFDNKKKKFPRNGRERSTSVNQKPKVI